MNKIARLFLFLSKTDSDILKSCTKKTKSNQVSLRVFVFFTGLFAFFSGSYAFSHLFQEFNPVTKEVEISTVGMMYSAFFGVIYGLFIMQIDREIVSAMSKKTALLRIPLAIIIGLVIAVPMELKLLEGRIEKQLFINEQRENKLNYISRQEALYEIDNRIMILENSVQRERAEVAKWQEIMEAEVVGRVQDGRTGIPGNGPAYREAKRNLDLHQKYLKEAEEKLKNYLSVVPSRKDEIKQEYQQKFIQQQYDILSKVSGAETD